MVLDERLPKGYVVLCASASDELHSFLVQRLGPSVECPECGRTALSAPLVEDYYHRRQAAMPDLTPYSVSKRRLQRTTFSY